MIKHKIILTFNKKDDSPDIASCIVKELNKKYNCSLPLVIHDEIRNRIKSTYTNNHTDTLRLAFNEGGIGFYDYGYAHEGFYKSRCDDYEFVEALDLVHKFESILNL